MEFHKASAPELSGTSQGICTGTLRNLTKHLLCQNLPEPHKVSAPEPSGASQGICPGTLLHQVAAPETSGTSPGSCTGNFRNRTEPSGASAGIFNGTLRNLTRSLQRNPPEPHEVSAPEPLRNLTRYLHQNPPELCPEPGVEAAPGLIWAKDPIAKFCCWGKKPTADNISQVCCPHVELIPYVIKSWKEHKTQGKITCVKIANNELELRSRQPQASSLIEYIYTYVVDAYCCMLIQIA